VSVETATHYRTETLVPLFQKMLERCKVNDEETVLVVTDPDSSQEYAAAMFAAARSFGADVMTLVLRKPPARSTHRSSSPKLISAT
jgi:2,5-dihydroxypyridine 5,6-dioxygenase